MRARTLILLIVALVLAGGTTMMARVWLASQRAVKQEAAPIAVPTPSKSVLIARSTIQRGQILRPDDLAWEPWPEGGIDKNYILLGARTPVTLAAPPGPLGIHPASGAFVWRLDAALADAFADQVDQLAAPSRAAGSELLECTTEEEIPVKVSRGEYTDDFLRGDAA